MATTTIRITPAGVVPSAIVIRVGVTVIFINEDSQPHAPAGGPDISRPDCPEVDIAGFLVPGQRGETAPFPVVKTCQFHDHMNHSPVFNGHIVIE